MILQKDYNGNTVGQYTSVAHASTDTGILLTNIAAVVRGSSYRKSAGGFLWEETEDIIDSPTAENQETDHQTHTFQHEYTSDNITFTGVLRDVEIKSLDDLLNYTDVDLSLWQVKNYTTKTWTTTMKRKAVKDTHTALPPIPGKGFVGKPYAEHDAIQVLNIGFTVNFIPKTDFKEKLIEVLKSHVAALPTKVPPKRSKPRYVVEYMITDHHLGKQGFDSKLMRINWTLEEAMAEYQNVVDFGLSKLNYDNVECVWLVCGNDYLHVDNSFGMTSHGTKLTDDLLYLNLFKMGKEAVAKSITSLVQHAPVKVIFVPGNHDEIGTLTMSEVIKAMFYNNPNVEVICSGTGREYQQFGTSLIGWHHGKGNNPQKAANMMITDVPEMWAYSKFRACHVGHTHVSKKTETVTLNTLEESHGLLYEICPTLCVPDRWHDQALFIGNLRRSKIFQYEYDKGLEAEYYYNAKG